MVLEPSVQSKDTIVRYHDGLASSNAVLDLAGGKDTVAIHGERISVVNGSRKKGEGMRLYANVNIPERKKRMTKKSFYKTSGLVGRAVVFEGEVQSKKSKE